MLSCVIGSSSFRRLSPDERFINKFFQDLDEFFFNFVFLKLRIEC